MAPVVIFFSTAKFEKIAIEYRKTFGHNKKISLQENKNNCFIVSLISFMVKKLGFLMWQGSTFHNDFWGMKSFFHGEGGFSRLVPDSHM